MDALIRIYRVLEKVAIVLICLKCVAIIIEMLLIDDPDMNFAVKQFCVSVFLLVFMFVVRKLYPFL